MTPLVSVEWLKEHRGSNNLIILDASPESTMSSTAVILPQLIIPDAIRFNIKEKFTDIESKYPNTIPSPKQFGDQCRKLGINKESKIVVYDNLGIYTSPRVWWLFKVMGHENVSVLDGGLGAWIEAKENTVDKYREVKESGDFKSDYQSDYFIDYEGVKGNVNTENYVLLDARSEGRFKGVSPEPRKHLQSGQILNSLNLPYTEVLENGRYKTSAELIDIFGKLELDERDLIFSCGSGMTACITMMACEMVLPNKTILYDGSWTEWAMKEGLII